VSKKGGESNAKGKNTLQHIADNYLKNPYSVSTGEYYNSLSSAWIFDDDDDCFYYYKK